MRSVDETVEIIANDLEGSGERVITYSWPKFYTICEAEKLHESRKNAIREALLDEHGLLMQYGSKVVLIAEDKFINRIK